MNCDKVKYSSKEFAEADIKRIKKKSTRDKIPQRAYLCSKCGCWHLTSQINNWDKLEELEKENNLLKLKNKELEILASANYNIDLIQKLQQAIGNKDKIIQNLRKINKELVIKTLIK